MLSIYDLKEMAVTDTPLLLFQCVLQNGQAEYWSTHQVTYSGNTYAPRVIKHNVFSVQTSSVREWTRFRECRCRWQTPIPTSRNWNDR
jgi:hypothetical protein